MSINIECETFLQQPEMLIECVYKINWIDEESLSFDKMKLSRSPLDTTKL